MWQGRFKSFPVERDKNLYAVLRYVERNPLRANLVDRAAAWPWGTLAMRAGAAARPGWLSAWPEGVNEPADRAALVDEPQTEAELAALRRSVTRGSPYGGKAWARSTAERLGLATTLRPRGRPRKPATEPEAQP